LVYPVPALLPRQTQQAGEVLGAAAARSTLVKISASDSPASSSAGAALNRFSRLWRHGTGYSLIGEPAQIPAIALGDTLIGAALDLDAHAVAGLLGCQPAAVSNHAHDRLP
jgi:hypothetical protein